MGVSIYRTIVRFRITFGGAGVGSVHRGCDEFVSVKHLEHSLAFLSVVEHASVVAVINRSACILASTGSVHAEVVCKPAVARLPVLTTCTMLLSFTISCHILVLLSCQKRVSCRRSASMRLHALSKYSLFSSKPMKCRFSLMHATAVVPLPMQLSRIVSPSLL